MFTRDHLDTRSENFEEGPPVFFSHNNIIWSAPHDLSRIGMNALRVSLEAMFKVVTGNELKTTTFGKPQNRNVPVGDSGSAPVAQRHTQH